MAERRFCRMRPLVVYYSIFLHAKFSAHPLLRSFILIPGDYSIFPFGTLNTKITSLARFSIRITIVHATIYLCFANLSKLLAQEEFAQTRLSSAEDRCSGGNRRFPPAYSSRFYPLHAGIKHRADCFAYPCLLLLFPFFSDFLFSFFPLLI